ncbi:MAG: hypothetical protein JJU13_08355 [Balneolaceae bacterium]|nr:hypothetical protein [Balneolaceae bacterium]
MWFLIIVLLIAVFIFGKFISDSNKQNRKIEKEGGMRHKYRELIDLLLSGTSDCEVYKVDSNSVTLRSSSVGGTTLFTLVQTFGRINIKWELKSPVFGSHDMIWEFPEYHDQQVIVDRILNDLVKYQNNVATSKGLPGIK